jgi:acetyl esterase/lipase
LGEAKYPACLEDATAAYNYVQTNMKVPPERIIIAGDSAGGNILKMMALSSVY